MLNSYEVYMFIMVVLQSSSTTAYSLWVLSIVLKALNATCSLMDVCMCKFTNSVSWTLDTYAHLPIQFFKLSIEDFKLNYPKLSSIASSQTHSSCCFLVLLLVITDIHSIAQVRHLGAILNSFYSLCLLIQPST